MAEIIKRNKACSVSPLKSSQTIGAALAFLGMGRSIPMLHGSQGCTAFGKVYFVRHFREPIPLQTTAMDQVSAVMGADDNVVEGLRTLCEKSRPDIIGLPTTGLSETEGCDIHLSVREFRAKYPEYDDIAVVPVNAPDYVGCLESGFASAVKETLDILVPETDRAGTQPGRVNLLLGAALTPGDVEELCDLVERFGLEPVAIPNLGDSLDGHLVEEEFTPLTLGGTPRDMIATIGDAAATIVVGASMAGAADLLAKRTAVPDYRFDHLMGLEATDRLMMALSEISERPVPARLERQRSQVQDAMLDTHFSIGKARIAVAADPDLLSGFCDLLSALGAEVPVAVTSTNAPVLERLDIPRVKIGDLEDLELMGVDEALELLIGNSHVDQSAKRLGLPMLHAGFPQWEVVGGYARSWIGYRGTRQALFDIANLLLETPKGAITPHVSIYAQHSERKSDGIGATAQGPRRPH